MWSVDHVANEKRYTSTFTRPMTTELGTEVASDEKVLYREKIHFHETCDLWLYHFLVESTKIENA